MNFDAPDLLGALEAADAGAIDAADFGIVAMKPDGVVEAFLPGDQVDHWLER